MTKTKKVVREILYWVMTVINPFVSLLLLALIAYRSDSSGMLVTTLSGGQVAFVWFVLMVSFQLLFTYGWKIDDIVNDQDEQYIDEQDALWNDQPDTQPSNVIKLKQ